MRRWAKVVARVLVVVVAVLLIFAGSMYVCAWYYRWRAGQLLAAVKTLTPGVTTEAEYMRAIKPLEGHLIQIMTDGPGNKDVPMPGGFALGNHPDWVYQVFYSERLRAVRVDRIMPFDTTFMVMPTFTNGKLSRLAIDDDQGSGHPFGAFVTYSAKQYEDGDPAFYADPAGYRVVQMTNGPGVWETHVSLDERATPTERSSALDFRFECFTRYRECRDADLFLKPAPNR